MQQPGLVKQQLAFWEQTKQFGEAAMPPSVRFGVLQMNHDVPHAGLSGAVTLNWVYWGRPRQGPQPCCARMFR